AFRRFAFSGLFGPRGGIAAAPSGGRHPGLRPIRAAGQRARRLPRHHRPSDLCRPFGDHRRPAQPRRRRRRRGRGGGVCGAGVFAAVGRAGAHGHLESAGGAAAVRPARCCWTVLLLAVLFLADGKADSAWAAAEWPSLEDWIDDEAGALPTAEIERILAGFDRDVQDLVPPFNLREAVRGPGGWELDALEI